MDEPHINDWYDHQHSPSVFVMFTRTFEVARCYSGNELRRAYLEHPDDFISAPLELRIPDDLDKRLRDMIEND